MVYEALRKLRFSVSMKAALIVLVPIVAMMTLHIYREYAEGRAMMFRSAEMQLLRIAEGLHGPVETALREEDGEELQDLVRGVAKGADVKFAAVFDPRGAVAAGNEDEWAGRSLRDLLNGDLTEQDAAAVHAGLMGGYSVYRDDDDKQHCLVMPLDFGEGFTGALYLSLDMRNMDAELTRATTKDIATLAVLIVVIVASILFFFHHFFLKRVRAVSTAAVWLAGGDVAVRAHVSGTDEIGSLAASFNAMADEIRDWRTNLEDMVSSRVSELSALYHIASIIGESLESDKVLPRILNHILETLKEHRGVIVLAGGDGKTLRAPASRGLSEEAVRQVTTQGLGCVGDVILKSRPLRVGRGEQDEASTATGLEEEGVASALAVPVSVHGATLGCIAVYSARRARFSEQDEALLITIGNQVGVALETARLYEQTLELARQDGLTKLANRRHLMELLARETSRAERYHTALSALLLDLDKFKRFNDTYGHLKGDELLKAFGALIRGTIRASDEAGRYGGEEFCVILPNTSLQGAVVIAERLRAATEQLTIPLDGGGAAGITVSIGAAELSEGQDVQKLLENADAALYRAKDLGRNRVAAA